MAVLEEGREGGFRLDGDDAPLVKPDLLEEQAEELALGVGVGLQAPEDAEVVEDLAGLIEVGEWLGREFGQLGVDRVAAREVVAAVQVAQLVEVAHASHALFERGASLDHVGALGGGGVGEALQDLVSQAVAWLEVRDERDELGLHLLDRGDRLVAVAAAAAAGAVVAGGKVSADGGAVHSLLAALAAREAAKEIAVGRPAGFERTGALAAQLADAIEELLVDDRLVHAADLLGAVAAAGDVAAIRGVAEHLANRVRAEAAPCAASAAALCRQGGQGALS